MMILYTTTSVIIHIISSGKPCLLSYYYRFKITTIYNTEIDEIEIKCTTIALTVVSIIIFCIMIYVRIIK